MSSAPSRSSPWRPSAPRAGHAFLAEAYDPDEAAIPNTWRDTHAVPPGTAPVLVFADAVRADR
jgi:hypothetical protein